MQKRWKGLGKRKGGQKTEKKRQNIRKKKGEKRRSNRLLSVMLSRGKYVEKTVQLIF